MRILCGTDFSSSADAAALVAAKLASELGADLDVVSVIPPGMDEEPLVHTLAADADDLMAAAPRIANLDTTIVRADDAAAALVSRAAHVHADLLVVAARGASATKDRLGRVAERVVADSNVPVLLVQDAELIRRWLDRKEPLRVLFSASLKPSQDAAMDLVARLRAVAPCDVTALHVASPSQDAGPPSAKVTKETLLAELQRRVRGLAASSSKGQGELACAVEESLARVDDRILDAAAERRSSLIVLGSHRRGGAARLFHASVAASVLRHAATNVLIAPDTAARDVAPRIERVLVPIDHVEGAARSVAVACSLLPGGGDVELVHVVDAHDAHDVHERAGAGAASFITAMKSLAPKDAASAGIRVSATTIAAPSAARAISAHALACGADAICMRARTPRRGAGLLGSVLDEVLRTSTRPIVVVPDER